MDWRDSNAQVDFVDALQVFHLLAALTSAETLSVAGAKRFPADPQPISEAEHSTLKFLESEGFVSVLVELENDIERLRRLEVDGARVREGQDELIKRQRELSLQLRRAEHDSRFLKGQAAIWEDKSRRELLQNELRDLTLRQRRLEGEIQRSELLFRELLDRIYREPALREARWWRGRGVVLTYDGVFLYEYLQDLNPNHFQGRTLSEILLVGASLA